MTLLDWNKPGRVKQLLDPTWIPTVEVMHHSHQGSCMSLHLKNPLIWLYDKNGAGAQEESTKLVRRREYVLNFGVVNVNMREIIVSIYPSLITGGSIVTSAVKIDPPYSGALALAVRVGYEDIELSELPWIISLSAIA
jgi:hypothetical protein